ncbi:2,3-bisphosphoglycerate-independent phosphoglycerate mutase [Marinagarivorans cellulosilyticus]|uniref:2,3-bisphosphoglycerate-independent phosphoglycerate mutase n=1 Tax=Marinagarivorans cellulosilyticus TaxID=2721545 RepID=A0AAN1WHX2_9GAMM|nr:2,3-bisphosphoglycerate-independent phosphoglycerate mutase [Marinagarivorans cellulosilyticus]BCD97874.1 2,3-bisphosphoglycerate-independent phosphoglycerate mutase [Marinagarivorans cellulosilyticus]
MSDVKKPLVLLILDGFGYSEVNKYNAIANAKAPVWKGVCENSPNTLIATSGLEVGLPEGQMGNSEVGHMTLGAGRVIYQNFTRINKAISDGDFFTNSAYTNAVDKAIANDKAVHIFGLLSDGGVHSHEDHMLAALKLAAERGAKKLYLHAFLDGRDTPPRSAESALSKAQAALKELGVGRIASVVGRFFALDRDNRWDRVEQAYNVMVNGEGLHTATSAQEALAAAYARDENDEFVGATTIVGEGESPVRMEDGDSAIFMNFRPDRAREITHAIIDADFDGFERKRTVKLADYVMTTEYAATIDAPCAFPPEDVKNSFGEVLQNLGKKQLRIAETEKYAHVTFFFSGGQETLYDGEERILVPSPNVATYDLKPEMSAFEVTDKLIAAIESNQFDAIICNYANCDQVGHSGVYDAAVKAVETVDECMGRIFECLEKVGGHALVTADHGNVEEMFDEESNQVHTQHTTLPVPLAYVGPLALTLKSGGSLADIAPTMLALMNLEQPAEMTGKNLTDVK